MLIEVIQVAFRWHGAWINDLMQRATPFPVYVGCTLRYDVLVNETTSGVAYGLRVTRAGLADDAAVAAERRMVITDIATRQDASTVSVTVEVINANGNSGSKVVQVYFSPPPSRVTRYKKMLAGFTKVAVPAHGSTQAVVEFKTTVLGHWDPRLSKHVIDPGKYLVGVCHDSTSARCVTSALVVPVPRAGQ